LAALHSSARLLSDLENEKAAEAPSNLQFTSLGAADASVSSKKRR